MGSSSDWKKFSSFFFFFLLRITTLLNWLNLGVEIRRRLNVQIFPCFLCVKGYVMLQIPFMFFFLSMAFFCILIISLAQERYLHAVLIMQNTVILCQNHSQNISFAGLHGFACGPYVEILRSSFLSLCFFCSLSVAKWIHLNWGDDGLIILFAKIWKLALGN